MKRPLVVFCFAFSLTFFLSGCTELTTGVYCIGLREQYVEKNKQASTASTVVYDIKDAPMLHDNSSVYRSLKGQLLAEYSIDKAGVITQDEVPTNTKVPLKISGSELHCISCIKPIRYRKPVDYLGYPLMLVTVPLDAAATLATVPFVALFVISESVFAITCSATGTSCH